MSVFRFAVKCRSLALNEGVRLGRMLFVILVLGTSCQVDAAHVDKSLGTLVQPTTSLRVSTKELGFIGLDQEHKMEPGVFGLRLQDHTLEFELINQNPYIT